MSADCSADRGQTGLVCCQWKGDLPGLVSLVPAARGGDWHTRSDGSSAAAPHDPDGNAECGATIRPAEPWRPARCHQDPLREPQHGSQLPWHAQSVLLLLHLLYVISTLMCFLKFSSDLSILCLIYIYISSSLSDFSPRGEHCHHEVRSSGGERGAQVCAAGRRHPELRPGSRVLQTSHWGWLQGWDPGQTGPGLHRQPHPPAAVGQGQPVRHAGLILAKWTHKQFHTSDCLWWILEWILRLNLLLNKLIYCTDIQFLLVLTNCVGRLMKGLSECCFLCLGVCL